MGMDEIITEMWNRVRVSEDGNYVRSSDVCNVINRIRVEECRSIFNAAQWLAYKPVKELISSIGGECVIKSGTGRVSATWINKFLAIEMLMSGGGAKAKMWVYNNSDMLSKIK